MAGVLSELGKGMDPERLVEASQSASALWAQRLGYLLEHVGAAERTVLPVAGAGSVERGPPERAEPGHQPGPGRVTLRSRPRRGGTALYKAYLKPVARYSEDTDLDQVESGQADPMMDGLRTDIRQPRGARLGQEALPEYCAVGRPSRKVRADAQRVVPIRRFLGLPAVGISATSRDRCRTSRPNCQVAVQPSEAA